MGISKTQLAEALASPPLADLTAAGQPVFAVSLPEGVVVWINGSALALFGVSGSNEMSRALETGSDPVVRQLARTAKRSRAGNAPQLQKLIFRRQGRAGTVLTVRCWSITGSGDSSVFWVAALDAPAAMCKLDPLPEPMPEPQNDHVPLELPAEKQTPERTQIVSASAAMQDQGKLDTLSESIDGQARAAAKSGTMERGVSATRTSEKHGEPARRRNVRFMWRSDGNGRLVSIDGALCEVMGCETGELTGQTFDSLIETLPLQPGGPLRAALARRDTWSRIEVLWPFAASNKCAPVTLGGLPSYDRSGLFDGYSGFGVIHLDDITERPQLVATRNDIAAGDGDNSGDDETVQGKTPPVVPESIKPDQEATASAPLETETLQPVPGGNVVSLRAWQTGNKPAPEAPAQPGDAAIEDDTSSEISGKASLQLNVPKADPDGSIELSAAERNAFREIARALGARTRDGEEADGKQPAGKDGEGKKKEAVKYAPAASSLTPHTDVPERIEPASMAGLASAIAATHAAAGKVAADKPAAEKAAADKAAADKAAALAVQTKQDDTANSAATSAHQNDHSIDASSVEADSVSASTLAADTSAAGDIFADDKFVDEKLADEANADEAIADAANANEAFAGEEIAPGSSAGEDALKIEGKSSATQDQPAQDSQSEDRNTDELEDASAADNVAAAKAEITGNKAGSAGDIGGLGAFGSSETSLTGSEHAVARPVLIAVPPQEPSRDTAVAALMDRLGIGVLLSQGGDAVYANQPLLDRLGYRDFEAFQGAGGIGRMFRGRDPELLAREAAGGAIPVITRAGDVLAMDGKSHGASWNGAPATLLTMQPSQMLEREAKLRGLELDIRKRESEVRELHSILDTATDGVALIDEDGRILSLNGSGQALFSYDQNEVVGEKFTVLLARESHGAAMDYFNGLKSNGVRNVLNDGREVQGRASKGGAIPLFMTIGCISNGPEQRFCAVLRDVTQWKKAERELSESRHEAERTSSLKSEFLAKISHEVRTPLNAILGFAEVIIDERFGPIANERYKDYLKDIHASGTHVLSLINDLLDLSKIEAGKLELDFGSVDVSKVVNECVSIMQSHAIRERVIMRLSLAPRLPNVVADERSLRQIILNILSNAIKYNEPGGQVIVSTALTDAGSAVIRVRDTGIGMSDKDVELALEPFRQIATSRRSGGTGLGLPLTKALVEANRASFTIKSKKDEGTLVEVAFPQTRVLAE